MVGWISWAATFAVVLGSALLYPTVVKIHRRSQRPRPDGIKVVSDPPGARFEIVAVHGLGAHPEYSWMRETPANKHLAHRLKKVHLLRDLLKDDFPDARILSFAYNSDWLIDAPVKTAQQIGDRLLAQLQTNRSGRRLPLIFVGHSFGGIIIKEALCKSEADSRLIIDDTCGIIFLGTPHQGSSISAIGAAAAFLTGFLGSNTGLVLSLKRQHSQLTDLESRFRSCIRQKEVRQRNTTIVSFCETKPTYLLRWFSIGLVVDQESARGPAAKLIPIDTDHSGLNKCSGREDRLYKELRTEIRSLQAPSILEEADSFIRHHHYTPDRLKIERLSGKPLSMDQCYINLAIVEQSGRNADRSKQGDTAPRPSQTSLFARLKVETPIEEIRVELLTLFNPRKGPDGRTTQPRRILIRGRAGVGKTTLCKRIVHDFTRHGIWNDLFDRMLWVPLRRLKARRDLQYNLEELFYAEYFSQHVEGRRLSNALWRALDTNCGRTLFILDGLDEVSQGLGRDDNMSRFLQTLLNQPSVIITSRPYAVSSAGLRAFDVRALDLELETIGFYPDQVKEYVENAFKDDPEKVDEVQSFLHNHWLIQSLVRIPIQLDALCFTWDGSDSETIPQTLTDVYKAIEQRLWKKDALRLEKKHDGEPVTDSHIQGSHPSEIEDLVKDEIYFLEGLAFTGLYNDVIDFESSHRNVISKQFKPPMTTFLLDKTLPRLSFLRTSDPSPKHSNRSYHFLHLTFQEYFAARYFVRQWKAREPLECLQLSDGKVENTEPAAFIRKHKYTAHYDVFWRFVAGLLDAERETPHFFQTIEEEPRDLLGPTHQRLVMHCLSEVYSSSMPIRTELEQKLLQWLFFECNFARSARLASEVEFPEQVLETALQEGSDERKKIILRWLALRPRIPPSIIKLAASWLGADQTSESLKIEVCSMLQSSHEDLSEAILQAIAAQLENPEKYVRQTVVDALGGQSNLPEAILQAIAARLEDPEGNVRRAAVDALGGQWTLLEAIVQAVMARLEHPECYVRQAAVDVLSRILPKAIVQAVIARLEDPKEYIRGATADALSGQSTLPEAILQAIAARLKDPEEYVRGAAVDALNSQSTLPEAILQTIAAQLEDPEEYIRRAAADALGGQSTLPEAILQAVAARLEDPEEYIRGEYIRGAAVDALGGQSTLPEAILQAVAARLEDPGDYVKEAAINILGSQSTLPEVILQAVAARLEDSEEYIRGAAADVLHSQLTLPEATFQAVAAQLEDPGEYVRGAAIYALSGQSALPETILQTIAAQLEDPEEYIRQAAADALNGQSTLPEAIVQAVVARLEDPDEDVRSAAVGILTGQSNLPEATFQVIAAELEDPEEDIKGAAADTLSGQSTLPEAILQAVAARLEDPEEYIRGAAADVLRGQSTLPEAIVQAVAARLEDPGEYVRRAAIDALGYQSTLPEAILQAVAARLEDPEEYIRGSAADVLRGQSTLPEAIVQAVAARLKDPEGNVRRAAAHALGGQSTLPEAIVQAVAAQLEDPEEDIKGAAADALSGQSTLSEAILQAVAARLEDPEEYIRGAAADVLRGQSTLPEAILQAVAARLEDPGEYVRGAAMDVLRSQSTLPEAILQALALQLESERASDLAEAILRRHVEFYSILLNGRFMTSLYWILLRRSFKEQVSWYVEDGSSWVSMPEGFRRASIPNQQDQFRP